MQLDPATYPEGLATDVAGQHFAEDESPYITKPNYPAFRTFFRVDGLPQYEFEQLEDAIDQAGTLLYLGASPVTIHRVIIDDNYPPVGQ